MKVSTDWLKELVDLKIPIEELIKLLPLRTIGLKEITSDYIELDMKGYNRADLLSLRGVAREVAAVTGSRLLFSSPALPDYSLPQTEVQIEDGKLCPVYCLAKIEGVKVEPSSSEWVKKLKDSGMRSVNNIADVTNLMMLEYGQPMHAFDAQKVSGSVRVRVAKQEEKITTLDGKIRNLDKEDLLIADDKGPIGIAGVMGGKDSEITDNTTTILLEAAIFDPVKNRLTSKRHGIYSEATKRFQHGLTKTNLQQALAVAIKMYENLGGKLTAITLLDNLDDQLKTITLAQEKINSLIGLEIPSADIESSLEKLGFKLASHSSSGNVVWDVTIPYFRLDINIEEDLVEEVARMYGYEKIPAKALEGELPQKFDQSFPDLIYSLKKALADAGLTEVQTYSFYSTKVIKNLELPAKGWSASGGKIENLLKVANPISSETEYMRDNLWPNLLEVTAKNIRNGIKDIAIFEIGKVYSPVKGDLPKEVYHLSIALSNSTDNPIRELYQISQAALKHLRGVNLNTREYFHPTRYTDGMAEIHPRYVNKFGIEQRVAVLEIELESFK